MLSLFNRLYSSIFSIKGLSGNNIRHMSTNSNNDDRVYDRTVEVRFPLKGLPRIEGRYGTAALRALIMTFFGSFAGFKFLSTAMRFSAPEWDEAGSQYVIKGSQKASGTHAQHMKLESDIQADMDKVRSMCRDYPTIGKVNKQDVSLGFDRHSLSTFRPTRNRGGSNSNGGTGNGSSSNGPNGTRSYSTSVKQ